MGLQNTGDEKQRKRGFLEQIWRGLRQGMSGCRSSIYYRSSLRVKILVPVFVITFVVIGVLAWLSFTTLYTTIAGIYEQRARSVASVVSKSLQEKAYILYYSDELESDIDALMKRYDSIVGITVTGITGRGLRVVASTDSSTIGEVLSEDEQAAFLTLRDVQVSRARIGKEEYLHAEYPLFMDADLVRVVSVDMSLAEQQRYITKLSWQLGLASLVGFLVLGMLLYGILHAIVTRPIFRLATAAKSVSQRKYDVQVSPGPTRQAGVRVRDEVARFIDVFNLMIKVLGSHEHALREMIILDEVTGSYTFSYFQRLLDQEMKKGRRYGHPTSILVIDISEIEELSKSDKQRLLLATANFLMGKLRSVDPLFRASDDRFVALLPETPLAGAQIAAERLANQTADLKVEMSLSFTIIVRATGWSGEETPELEEVLRQVRAPHEDDRG